jgi:phenylpyruvate tautomerase PptA (4-oxalocrotonate tautomerase family)
MPFVQISLSEEATEKVKKDISMAVHESLMEAFHIPADDYFQVIRQVPAADLLYPDSYMNIPHKKNLVYIQIIARHGRTVEMKQQLYKAIAGKIAERTPVSVNDVIIVLVENASENWSLGQGVAQMAGTAVLP